MNYPPSVEDTTNIFNQNCFISRSADTLVWVLKVARNALIDTSRKKQLAQVSGQEIEANEFLSAEFLLKAYISELSMLLCLKGDDSDTAWDHLIDSQNHTLSCARAHSSGIDFCERNYSRLEFLEKGLFPDQKFGSPQVIYEKQLCSICGTDYELCEHIEGRPKNGELCFLKTDTILQVEHLAEVKNPKSKKLRVVSFTAQGTTRNWNSLLEIAFQPGPPEDLQATTSISYRFEWNGS